MRWENQEVKQDDQARLPGYNDGAVVRTFDAPEALSTRFYEVRAKSALNHVPKSSRVPFEWTINPYRGCSHACVYCVWGDVPVLMADGRTRKIADLEIGDEVVGTVSRGRYRRYVRTEVLAHWSAIKPVWIVKLEDGTRILASGDHRFLTRRGWKHVVNSDRGQPDRPHLTTNDELLGTGHFESPPKRCDAYKRGYLCGLIRGDGHLRSYFYASSSGRRTAAHGFRLALTDFEALRRAQLYLQEVEIPLHEFVCQQPAGNYRAVHAIRTGARHHVERIQEIIRWPLHPNNQWRKGFLAGIFDAEGSCSGAAALCISNTDGEILHWTQTTLEHFGFDATVEDRDLPNKLRVVRIRGGLKERLRFFHLTDPAITRKRTIEGVALKSDAKTGVVSVEPLGMELPLHDITTGTGDFIADGVISHNCFARPTHEFLGFNAGRDFDREIVVKVNLPEVLRAELARPGWMGEHVGLGTNTDPYQWVEGRYKLMRGVWEAMRDFSNPCSILTKSPLLLRDSDLLLEIAVRAQVNACLSVPTLDEKAWRATEPHTPHPRARLEAVAELNRIGIPTGVLIAPLMPGINDAPGQVEEIVRIADEAGATSIGGQALFLRGSARDVFMDWLRAKRPDLVERYEDLYARGAYMPAGQRRALETRLPRHRRAETATRFERPPATAAPAAERRREEVRQTTLF